MKRFEIYPTSDVHGNACLKSTITGFCHTDYNGGSGNWSREGSIENMIWTLKNDVSPFPSRLQQARTKLQNILMTDLPQIRQSTGWRNLTVCVVPRSKQPSYYRADQLYFHTTVSNTVNLLGNGFFNGTTYIKRHTNTRTTHLNRNGEGGDGAMPYAGITKATCTISPLVNGKDILLIDDLYTRSINIDEDAIQALIDHGARSVTFYAIGNTVARYVTINSFSGNSSSPVDDLPF